jgi:hypothetical protein
MQLLYLLLITSLLILTIRLISTIEPFFPIRYEAPTLYATTGPVDMLIMKKFLFNDGYRFQNSMADPEPSNLNVDLRGQDGPRYQFPNNFRQRMGSFKVREPIDGTPMDRFTGDTTVTEAFESSGSGGGGSGGGGGGAASQATMAQLNNLGDQNQYLIGQKGDAIEDSGDNMNPFGRYVSLSPQIPAPGSYVFSWGNMIDRFYSDPESADINL